MIIFKIISAHSVDNLIVPEMVSPKLSELMTKLLHPYARDRPNVAETKAHGWFADMNWARLMGGELSSPLPEAALRVQAVRADPPPEWTPQEPYNGEKDEDWLSGFDFTEEDD